MLRKDAANSSRVSLTKQACDGCKVRKVRCGGGNPCRPCLNARIQCSYNRIQQTRGPQKLRTATRRLIEQSQRNNSSHAASSEHNEGASERFVQFYALAICDSILTLAQCKITSEHFGVTAIYLPRAHVPCLAYRPCRTFDCRPRTRPWRSGL